LELPGFSFLADPPGIKTPFFSARGGWGVLFAGFLGSGGWVGGPVCGFLGTAQRRVRWSLVEQPAAHVNSVR